MVTAQRNKENSFIRDLFARYSPIILFGALLPFVYTILIPLHVYVLRFIYSISYGEVSIIGVMIRLPHLIIEIIPACTAGAAFYLLFILVFSTAELSWKKRIHMLLVCFSTLFALNIIRIMILASLGGTEYFDVLHWLFWHIISTIFVVAIWIVATKKYGIQKIPVYSDIKQLYGLLKHNK